MRTWVRVLIACIALTVAAALAFSGGLLGTAGSDLPPGSRDAATTAQWIGMGGLALSVVMSAALVARANAVAACAFAAVLCVDAALLVIVLSTCFSACGASS